MYKSIKLISIKKISKCFIVIHIRQIQKGIEYVASKSIASENDGDVTCVDTCMSRNFMFTSMQ
jgi:hypothetical protein